MSMNHALAVKYRAARAIYLKGLVDNDFLSSSTATVPLAYHIPNYPCRQYEDRSGEPVEAPASLSLLYKGATFYKARQLSLYGLFAKSRNRPHYLFNRDRPPFFL